MTDKELWDAAWAELEKTTDPYPTWKKKGFPAGTHWAKAKALGDQIGLGAPVSGEIAPPVDPTYINNAPGLGLNVTTRQDLHDYVINGTGNTGVLFQKDADWSTLKRARLLNIGIGNQVPYGKHAVYGKARDLLLEDIVATCSPYCASGLSMRYEGATVRRFSIMGAPHAITYYETSTISGQVVFEDGLGIFTGDTGIWIDVEPDYTTEVIQNFIFRRVRMTGPGAFMKVSKAFKGRVSLNNCTLNGKPLTVLDCPNVPNLIINT